MSKIYISGYAHKEIMGYLKGLGHEIKIVEPTPFVGKAISSHPDIYMCSLGSEVFFGNPKKLSQQYPKDIIYNACSTGKYFIHNLKYTDLDLLAAAKTMGQITVNVHQGYAKCSTVVVDADSIITADRGIYRGAQEAGLQVLKVEEAHVQLPGFDYGFLGGASGKVENTIIFNGDLEVHPDFRHIKKFIESRGLECVWFKGLTLTDIGSIIEEK